MPKRSIACILAALLFLQTGSAQVALPDIGDPARSVLSPSEEERLGEAFMRELRARITIVDDPEVTDYIQALGYRVASRSEAPNTRFRFFVVESPAINAFAAPGGFIGFNAGLILATEAESELAAVVAHEIAHVTQHHLARALQLMRKTSLPALAGLIAAIILGAAGGGEAGAAAAAAVTAGHAQLQLDFTRDNEREADRVGMQLLARAGFDPRAMPSFFERLQQSHRYYAQPPEFLSTHPVTASRIADSRSRAEQFPYRQYRDGVMYAIIRAKLQVMVASDPAQVAQRFEATLDSGSRQERVATRYGYALALLEMGKPERAHAEINKVLRSADGDLVPFQVALARTELALGHVEKALAIYDDALSLYPDNRALVQGYAEALLQAGQAKKVLALVDEYRDLRPLDATLYKLSAQAYARTGNMVDAQIAMAEYFYLDGQLDAAIHQIKRARAAPDKGFYRSARIEARLQQLETEQAERAGR